MRKAKGQTPTKQFGKGKKLPYKSGNQEPNLWRCDNGGGGGRGAVQKTQKSPRGDSNRKMQQLLKEKRQALSGHLGRGREKRLGSLKRNGKSIERSKRKNHKVVGKVKLREKRQTILKKKNQWPVIKKKRKNSRGNRKEERARRQRTALPKMGLVVWSASEH